MTLHLPDSAIGPGTDHGARDADTAGHSTDSRSSHSRTETEGPHVRTGPSRDFRDGPDIPVDGPDVTDVYNTQGDHDLADRAALRRVAGLSTELRDVTEVEYRKLQLEQVVLVGVWAGGTAGDAEASMAELARLAETAGSIV